MQPDRKPIAFVSYTHDSEEHRASVTHLVESLKRNGIDARFDRDVHGTPSGGWPHWMERQIDEADFVLVVCTPTSDRSPGLFLAVQNSQSIWNFRVAARVSLA